VIKRRNHYRIKKLIFIITPYLSWLLNPCNRPPNIIEEKFVDNMQRTDAESVASSDQSEQEWTDKGNAAAQEGDYEAAAEAFEQAVAANPNDARARYNLALAHQYLEE